MFPHVWMDFTADGHYVGRVEFELFDDDCPKTAENFRCLCTGEKGIGQQGKKLWYKGTEILKIVEDQYIQGGDIIHGDGTGGESIYGKNFPDENFKYAHERQVISMCNVGENTNSS